MGNSDYFFPQYGLTATFGKTATQTFPGLINILVKEVSYWSRKVMMDEAWFLRDHQIDPVEAQGLLSYFRLSSGTPDMVNFAQFNPNYAFESSSPRYNRAEWTPDFVITQEVAYDEETTSLVMVDSYHYHNVCPLYTYMKDGFCYSDPVYTQRLMFLPEWNTDTESLDWTITMSFTKYFAWYVQEHIDANWQTYDNFL